jgi:hypothetical protein
VLFLLAGIFVGAVSDWLWLIGKGWWSQTIFFSRVQPCKQADRNWYLVLVVDRKVYFFPSQISMNDPIHMVCTCYSAEVLNVLPTRYFSDADAYGIY